MITFMLSIIWLFLLMLVTGGVVSVTDPNKELLCQRLQETRLTCEEMESRQDSNITSLAMKRLREAWKNHELGKLTLSFAQYFKETE